MEIERVDVILTKGGSGQDHSADQDCQHRSSAVHGASSSSNVPNCAVQRPSSLKKRGDGTMEREITCETSGGCMMFLPKC